MGRPDEEEQEGRGGGGVPPAVAGLVLSPPGRQGLGPVTGLRKTCGSLADPPGRRNPDSVPQTSPKQFLLLAPCQSPAFAAGTRLNRAPSPLCRDALEATDS